MKNEIEYFLHFIFVHFSNFLHGYALFLKRHNSVGIFHIPKGPLWAVVPLQQSLWMLQRPLSHMESRAAGRADPYHVTSSVQCFITCLALRSPDFFLTLSTSVSTSSSLMGAHRKVPAPNVGGPGTAHCWLPRGTPIRHRWGFWWGERRMPL